MKFLFVGAHPDDLEFSCANLIRYLAQHGHDVKILCLTKGQFGIYDPAWIGPRLGQLRVRELHRAAKINAIGVEDIFFGELIDGFLKFTRANVSRVIAWVNRLQPDIIFAPEAFYAYYWQTDHIHCGRILYFIFRFAQSQLERPLKALYFYNTLSPNFWWPFADPGPGKKSFLAHQSQWWFIKWIMPLYALDKFNFWRKRLGSWKYAERYRRIFLHRQPKSSSSIARGILGLISNLKAFNPTQERYHVPDSTSEFAQTVRRLSQRFYPE